MNFFEVVQQVGAGPQAWCDGFGCAIPKPGRVPGPDGQRLINLLCPAGKIFYKALLNQVPGGVADHQYGYVAGRPRRDVILQVESWLGRLRANKVSAARTHPAAPLNFTWSKRRLKVAASGGLLSGVFLGNLKRTLPAPVVLALVLVEPA